MIEVWRPEMPDMTPVDTGTKTVLVGDDEEKEVILDARREMRIAGEGPLSDPDWGFSGRSSRGRSLSARGSMDPYLESMVIDYLTAEEDLRIIRLGVLEGSARESALVSAAARASEAEGVLRDRLGVPARPSLAMGSGSHPSNVAVPGFLRRVWNRLLGVPRLSLRGEVSPRADRADRR